MSQNVAACSLTHSTFESTDDQLSANNSPPFEPELDNCDDVSNSPVIPFQSYSAETQPIVVSTSPAKNMPNIWIPKLDLYFSDLEILKSNKWLNDAIIFATQSLLKDLTKGNIFGWQYPQCSKRK